MSYPKKSHLYNFSIRQLIGAACYADIAIAVGEKWSTSKLEEKIDGDSYTSYTKKYSRMRNGTIYREHVFKTIQDKLKINTLLAWRNHPLWPLLYDGYYHNNYILNALNSVSKNMRNILFAEAYDSSKKTIRKARNEVTTDLIKKITSYNNLDALVAITALAREARADNIYRISAFCAIQLHKLFPKVVCNTPQLYIRWPQLVEQFTKTIWDFPKTSTAMIWIPVDHKKLVSVISDEERLAVKNNVKLPPKHIFRVINKKPPLNL